MTLFSQQQAGRARRSLLAGPYKLSFPMADSKDPVGLLIGVTTAKERGINERDVHFPHFVSSCRSQ